MKFDVTTVGDCQVDNFVRLEKYQIKSAAAHEKKLILDFAQKIPALEFKVFTGGNALNTAVSFSRLGLCTAICAVTGKDRWAEEIIDRLKQENINYENLRQDPKTQTDKSVVLVTGGERTILSFHSKKKYLFPPDIQTSWVYLTSLGPGFEQIYRQAGKFISSRKSRLAFNPGTRQLMHSVGAVRAMLKHTELLFVNLDEAKLIIATKSNDPKSLLKSLHNLGANIVVVTAGIKGAYAFGEDGFFQIKSFPAKRADATGAGDAFASGFAAAHINGENVSESLRWGSINAASEISQVGVQQGLLHKNAFLGVLRKYTKFQAKIF